MDPLIAAIATPAGSGAIGMVRLSGMGAIDLVGQIFRPRDKDADLSGLPGYRGLLGKVFDGERDIDEVVAFFYRAPRSYTGEDMVELCCHGGAFLVQEVLRLCLQKGACPALPGEFTRRAFFNGKLNLVQAEAVCDLIAAQSESARRAALSAKDGALSTAIDTLVEKITALCGHLAAWADYPEEGIEEVEADALLAVLSCCLTEIDNLLGTYDRGRMIREGVDTAIVGKPNVGKSTLMNLLAGARRSIVTEYAGTTRDVVRDSVRIGGYLLNLADTAGIRDTDDVVELAGVELAKNQLASAALVLAVFDSSDALDENDRKILCALSDKPSIALINKIDLPSRLDVEEIAEYVKAVVPISALSGEGRDLLEECIAQLLGLDTLDTSGAIVQGERQRYCLAEARKALEEAVRALEEGITLDAVGVCMDSALDLLLSLTGQKASQAVVDEVFSRFCVGK